MSSVYLITDGEKIKIGVTRDIDKRIKQLQVGNPHTITQIYTSRELSNAYILESILHSKYDKFRVSTEWFSLTDEYIKKIIEYIEENGKRKNVEEGINVKKRTIPILNEYPIMFETLIMKRENDNLRQLVYDILFGTRESEVAKIILKNMGSDKFISGCKLVSGLIDCGWGYDKIKSFIQQTNTKSIAN